MLPTHVGMDRKREVRPSHLRMLPTHVGMDRSVARCRSIHNAPHARGDVGPKHQEGCASHAECSPRTWGRTASRGSASQGDSMLHERGDGPETHAALRLKTRRHLPRPRRKDGKLITLGTGFASKEKAEAHGWEQINKIHRGAWITPKRRDHPHRVGQRRLPAQDLVITTHSSTNTC